LLLKLAVAISVGPTPAMVRLVLLLKAA